MILFYVYLIVINDYKQNNFNETREKLLVKSKHIFTYSLIVIIYLLFSFFF